MIRVAPDYDPDRAANKNVLIVRTGDKPASSDYTGGSLHRALCSLFQPVGSVEAALTTTQWSPPSQTERAPTLVQVTIYRRLLIGRDGHLDQSEAYDIS